MRYLLAVVLLCVVTGGQLIAQNVHVALRSDSTQVLIGDWFGATLTIQAPQGYRISLPEKDADFVNAAYVESDTATAEENGGIITYSKEYTLTSFDSGSVAIVANVTYYKPGDTTAYVASSNEIPMDVLLVRIDTAGSYKDIKGILDVPYTWWDYIQFFAMALAAFTLLWFGWYRLKYRPEKEEIAPAAEPEPAILPEVLALEKLRALEQKQLWEQGKHKDYQSELTDTLREYIEGKFKFPALEETTPEIIRNMALKGIEPKLISEVELALQCADLTKFAKYQPDAVAHRQGLKTAYLFVEETKTYLGSVEEEARQMVTKPDIPLAEPRPGEPPVEAVRSDDDDRS